MTLQLVEFALNRVGLYIILDLLLQKKAEM